MGPMTGTELDNYDRVLLVKRKDARDQFDGPRVGDYAIFADGTIGRFSHHWGDSIQWSHGGSWYLGHTGRASFSGSLYDAIPLDRIVEREGELREGHFWFFSSDRHRRCGRRCHHDHWTAGNGISVAVMCRVYDITEAK